MRPWSVISSFPLCSSAYWSPERISSTVLSSHLETFSKPQSGNRGPEAERMTVTYYVLFFMILFLSNTEILLVTQPVEAFYTWLKTSSGSMNLRARESAFSKFCRKHEYAWRLANCLSNGYQTLGRLEPELLTEATIMTCQFTFPPPIAASSCKHIPSWLLEVPVGGVTQWSCDPVTWPTVFFLGGGGQGP